MHAKDCRKLASDQCQKYTGELIIIQLVLELIALVIGLLGLIRLTRNPVLIGIFGTLMSVATIIIAGPFEFSFINVAQKVYKDQSPEINDVFSGFKRFSQAFIVTALKFIFIFLWSLLLVVPGIIKSYSYSMAEYISYDDPNISSNDAITKSRQLMNGNKGKLFCLEISYIGWILLVVLTLGILGLWVMPKINQAKYNFYLNLVKQEQPKEVNASK